MALAIWVLITAFSLTLVHSGHWLAATLLMLMLLAATKVK